MDGALSALTQRNVVEATVAQLRKDLGLGPEELPVPEADVFEVLRSAVARRLEKILYAFSVVWLCCQNPVNV